MKNARIHILTLLTCIFVAFTLGLFAGRSFNHAPVEIQHLPAATVAPKSVAETIASESPIININTATSAQLQSLPTIGPVTAERIITYRNENGNFGSVGELINVPGIGEKTLELIWDLVTIGG